MNFEEYKNALSKVPYTDSVIYREAYGMLRHEFLPLEAVSVRGAAGVIKIPGRAVNQYGKIMSVTHIGESAFSENDRVTDIILPESIEYISPGAFSGCTELKRIVLPKVRAIYEGTFADCDGLEDVYFVGSPCEWDELCIAHYRHETEFGEIIPGTPTESIKAERFVHIPGNDALFCANVHFRCRI